MQSGGGVAEAMAKTLVPNLESFFVHTPQADALYRKMRGTFKLGLADRISVPLLQACSPEVFQTLVHSKLQDIPKCKEDPEKVPEVMANVDQSQASRWRQPEERTKVRELLQKGGEKKWSKI